MGGLSPLHILILAVVMILLLGGGRFSNMMGDVAKGVKQFKKGMADDDDGPRAEPSRREPTRLESQQADPAYDRERAYERDRDRDAGRVREDR